MKHFRLIAAAALVIGLGTPARAQFSQPQGTNTFRAIFQRKWDMSLPDPVKLIEVGPLTSNGEPRLLMMTGGKGLDDLKRKLMVTHWDGFRFVTEATIELTGFQVDTLMMGQFRDTKPKTIVAAPAPINNSPTLKTPPEKGAKKPPRKSGAPSAQVVTSEGVYEWRDNTLTRLYTAPLNLKLAVCLEKGGDLMLSGVGDNVTLYQISDNDVHPIVSEKPLESPGYVRYGVGLQNFTGVEAMQLQAGVRFAQTAWSPKAHWFIGVAPGSSVNIPDVPGATQGDRLVIYMVKPNLREKSFWTLRQADFDEAWRSEPFPGRILDIRVGDPKVEGQDGIVVLTAENQDQQHHLYFYQLVTGSFR